MLGIAITDRALEVSLFHLGENACEACNTTVFYTECNAAPSFVELLFIL